MCYGMRDTSHEAGDTVAMLLTKHCIAGVLACLKLAGTPVLCLSQQHSGTLGDVISIPYLNELTWLISITERTRRILLMTLLRCSRPSTFTTQCTSN